MPICIQTPILKVWSDFTSPRWSTSSIKYLINWDKGVTFWHTVQANQIDIFNISLSVISLIFPFLLYENFDLTFGELIPTLASRVRQLYFQASPDCSRSAREVAVRWPLTFQPHIITRNDEQSFKSSHFFFSGTGSWDTGGPNRATSWQGHKHPSDALFSISRF